MTTNDTKYEQLLRDIITMGDEMPVSGATIRSMIKTRGLTVPSPNTFIDANAYAACVACSGVLDECDRLGDLASTKRCTKCGGIHVVATSRDLVLRWVNLDGLTDQKPEDVTRYFDVTYAGADRLRRRTHGWFVPERDRAVVQFG